MSTKFIGTQPSLLVERMNIYLEEKVKVDGEDA